MGQLEGREETHTTHTHTRSSSHTPHVHTFVCPRRRGSLVVIGVSRRQARGFLCERERAVRKLTERRVQCTRQHGRSSTWRERSGGWTVHTGQLPSQSASRERDEGSERGGWVLVIHSLVWAAVATSNGPAPQPSPTVTPHPPREKNEPLCCCCCYVADLWCCCDIWINDWDCGPLPSAKTPAHAVLQLSSSSL